MLRGSCAATVEGFAWGDRGMRLARHPSPCAAAARVATHEAAAQKQHRRRLGDRIGGQRRRPETGRWNADGEVDTVIVGIAAEQIPREA